MFFRSVRFDCLLGVGVAIVFCFPQISSAQSNLIGMGQLRAEVGASNVNGSGVIVGQAEASNGVNYMPDQSLPDFAGKTFWDGTGSSNGTSTGHSTNMAKSFYGSITGYARGVTDITMFDANDWINGVTNYASGGDPLPSENNDPNGSNPNPQTLEVLNHSWIAREDAGVPNSVWTNILQRADFMVNRDNTTICVGTDNGATSTTPPLMAPGYNTITVGKSNGGHATGPTTFYGSGRYKPEIVVPIGTTSTATAITSGCVAVLKQNSRGTNADQNEVIKAILLAGATKEEFASWDRTTTRPIDEVWGCGELNIYNSYFILQGGEFDGSPTEPGTPSGLYGWDYSPSINSDKFYTFDIPLGIAEASILLTWNMEIVDLNSSPNIFTPSPNLANMDLELYDSSGTLIDSSVSAEHNIEHIYVQNLAGGQYTLRVISDQDHDFGLAWRINTPVLVEPDSFTTEAVVLRGSLADLGQSDNQKLVVAIGADTLTFDVKSFSPSETPRGLAFTFESSVRSAIPVEQSIFLFDYDADEYELVDTRPARVLGDEVVVVDGTGDLSRFVQPGTLCVEARITFTKQGLARGIQAFIDQAVWAILE